MTVNAQRHAEISEVRRNDYNTALRTDTVNVVKYENNVHRQIIVGRRNEWTPNPRLVQ